MTNQAFWLSSKELHLPQLKAGDGRSKRILTSGLYVLTVALYRTEPHPFLLREKSYNSTIFWQDSSLVFASDVD